MLVSTSFDKLLRMAKKKKPASKKKNIRKPTSPKRAAVKQKPAAKSKKAAKKNAGKTRAPKRKIVRARNSPKGRQQVQNPVTARGPRGLGAASGGQSGDIQGLSRAATYDSESVEELAEEGQAFESEAVSGVENALDPDQSEVTTSEVPEDDVPEEYQDPDES